MTSRRGLATSLMILAVLSVSIVAADPPEEQSVREDFTGFLSLVSGPAAGRASIFSMTVERWSTLEERKALYQALQAGGTAGLIKAMEDLDVGFVRFPNTLGWRLRIASSFDTPEGRKVRLVTDRPIAIEEYWHATRTEDYPVGIIEFTLPPEGDGQGVVLPAARVAITPDGKVEVTTPPGSTSAQRLTGVTVDKPKKSKKKKD